MPKLSLLSRGAGQVVRKTQEKLEVHFEPEDYLNWKLPERHCCVTRVLGDASEALQGSWGLALPKTYSTRKGALVLYSEDLAKPSRKLSKPQHRFRSRSGALNAELRTLQDLVRAILAYGGKQARRGRKSAGGQPYLHFLSNPPIQPDKQMRPGYSAKRYLLKLLKFAQIWDPNILQKLQHAGYIKDPFVLEENATYHRRKQDLSAFPPKYRRLPIFYSPGSLLWDQMEKANPGLGLSSNVESEPGLVEGCSREKQARRKPFRISLRKLSFHLSPQRSKDSTRRRKARDGGTAKHPNVGVHGTHELTKEERGPAETASQSALEEILPADTSELRHEKAHVTFYGGFFRGRKLSDSVHQLHPKVPVDRGGGGGGGGGPAGLLPRVEQSGVRKPQGKQMPEMFRLPQISDEQLRAQRAKLKSRMLPKELTIFPLLVRLSREPHTKRKNPRAVGHDAASSEAEDCSELLAPLTNDRCPEPEQRSKMHQVVNSETRVAPHCSSYLPPIRSRDFAIERTKTGKSERGAETDSQRESIPVGVSALGPLPAITRKKDPGDHDIKANFGTCISTDGACKDLPVGLANSVLQEKLRGWDSSTPLSSLPKGPGGEIVCPLPLGSTQTTGDPEGLEFAPVEAADGTESLANRTGVPRSPPDPNASAPDLNEKVPLVTLQTQEAEKVQDTENSLPEEQSIMGKGSGSIGAKSRGEIQQSQDDFLGNHLLLQRKEKKGDSGGPKTQGPKQKEAAQMPSEELQGRRSQGKAQLDPTPQAKTSRGRDTGKRMENSSQSNSFSCLEPSLSQWTIPESEMDPDSAVLEFPGLSKELSLVLDMHRSDSQAEEGEDDKAILPEKPSLQTKSTGHISAGNGLRNKRISRQKKPDLRKVGPKSRAQKKSLTEEAHQSRANFVVGKPKQKKAIGKKPFSKEKKGDGKNPEVPEQTEEEEERREVETEVEHFDSDAEQDTLGRTMERTSSLSLREEDSLPPEYDQPFPADVEHPPGSHSDGAQDIPTGSPPAVGSQMEGGPSSGLHEVLLETKGEEKLSRERLIAERAEKRRLAVERKRREQEELKQKQLEDQAQMERMKEEMEEEKQRRMEEIRLRKQQLQEVRQRQEEEAARRLQAEKAAQERFRQQQEELRRKLLEAQKKKEEEERDHAAERRRQKEREMWLEEENRRLAEMAEEQRAEYEQQKREEGERARREAEERRKKEEDAAKLALEEARRQALLLARHRAQQEHERQFQHTFLVESCGLERRQDISRPWVYSYFPHPFLKVGDDDC
ncbi:uncharacterized protein KIAA2012 homolog isoform X5 [Paroedura picta]|uniref:uncharacterized protein KIAA2012 homolog isoform X5 n=1 Tax=Paroedura picta TaxID=143630 RepID=UPI004057946F